MASLCARGSVPIEVRRHHDQHGFGSTISQLLIDKAYWARGRTTSGLGPGYNTLVHQHLSILAQPLLSLDPRSTARRTSSSLRLQRLVVATLPHRQSDDQISLLWASAPPVQKPRGVADHPHALLYHLGKWYGAGPRRLVRPLPSYPCPPTGSPAPSSLRKPQDQYRRDAPQGSKATQAPPLMRAAGTRHQEGQALRLQAEGQRVAGREDIFQVLTMVLELQW